MLSKIFFNPNHDSGRTRNISTTILWAVHSCHREGLYIVVCARHSTMIVACRKFPFRTVKHVHRDCITISSGRRPAAAC